MQVLFEVKCLKDCIKILYWWQCISVSCEGQFLSCNKEANLVVFRQIVQLYPEFEWYNYLNCKTTPTRQLLYIQTCTYITVEHNIQCLILMCNFLWDQSSFPILKLIQMCQINEDIPSSLPEYKIAEVDAGFYSRECQSKRWGHQPVRSIW